MYFGWWFFCLVAGSTVYQPVTRQKHDEKLKESCQPEGSRGWEGVVWGKCTFTDTLLVTNCLELCSLVSDKHMTTCPTDFPGAGHLWKWTRRSWDSVGICKICAASRLFSLVILLILWGIFSFLLSALEQQLYFSLKNICSFLNIFP